MSSWRIAAAAAASVVLACGAPGPDDSTSSAEALVVCAKGPVQHGVDVSYYQGTIDWKAVAHDGKAFAFARVSDGTFIDPEFDKNWPAMRSAGLVRGVYQYFRVYDDPFVQADIVLKHVGALRDGDLPPVIDVEPGGMGCNSQGTNCAPRSLVVDHVKKWIDRVEKGVGRKPIIYSGRYAWDDDVGSNAFSDYPYWIPEYTTASCPDLSSAWKTWRFWQNTDHEPTKGITLQAPDGDLFDGSADALAAFAREGGPSDRGPRRRALPVQRAVLGRGGKVLVFARGTNHAILRIQQTSADGPFGPWHDMGGSFPGNPVAAAQENGLVNVFAVDGDGSVRWNRQHADGSWDTTWADLGGDAALEPAVAMHADGTLDVFVRKPNGTLAHARQDAPNGGFGAWKSLGGSDLVGEPVVGTRANGLLTVFVRQHDGRIWRVAQDTTGDWSTTGTFDGPMASSPAVGNEADGNLVVAATGDDGKLHVRTYGHGWSDWKSLGGDVASGPTIVARKDGRLLVLAVQRDGRAWLVRQSSPNGSFEAGAPFGGDASTPLAAQPYDDGRVSIYALTTHGDLAHRWIRTDGTWSDWQRLDGDVATF